MNAILNIQAPETRKEDKTTPFYWYSQLLSRHEFFAEQIEYLGYWITRQDIQPIRNKVEMNLILNIKTPKTTKAQQPTTVYWYSQQ
jgi:hypothetical protein